MPHEIVFQALTNTTELSRSAVFTLYTLTQRISHLVFCSLLKPLKYGACFYDFIKSTLFNVTDNLYQIQWNLFLVLAHFF